MFFKLSVVTLHTIRNGHTSVTRVVFHCIYFVLLDLATATMFIQPKINFVIPTLNRVGTVPIGSSSCLLPYNGNVGFSTCMVEIEKMIERSKNFVLKTLYCMCNYVKHALACVLLPVQSFKGMKTAKRLSDLPPAVLTFEALAFL